MTQELRKLAEAATQGEWNKCGNAKGWRASHDGLGSSEYRPIKDASGTVIALVVAQSEEHWVRLDTGSNAAYIAAANPAAILALLDRVEKAEKDAAVAIGMLADWCVAVDVNGTGWDDWDEHYKDAMYRPCPIREQLDEAIKVSREERQ